VFRAASLWVVCAALLAGCMGEGPRGPDDYVVQPQDTLYSIAWRNGLDYRDLAEWNHIGPSYRIEVGERLILRPNGAVPRGGARIARRASAPRSGSAAPPPHGPATIGGPSRPAAPAHKWVWPTDLIGRPQRLVNGGLLLRGKLGQAVRAAAAGHVVYTGSGIRGFGLLVIIKHDANLLSAYAYNSEVLVREDQDVAAGQVIARMGEGSHQIPTLYFEIRSNGRTVDPIPYLLDKK